jgi:hypothetical protein
MIDQTRLLVDKQVRAVRRRLLFQVVVQSVILCWAVGFLLTTFWFLLRPFVLAGVSDEVRWGVPAGLLGVSTLTGLLLAWLRRPNLLVSTLALDERFQLKERVTTLLTLPNEAIETGAGQALLRDVSEHMTNLHVANAFPLRIAGRNLLLPAGALALALIAAVVDPMLSDLKFSSRTNAEEPRRLTEIKEVQKQLDNLKKVVAERNKEDPLKSEKLKELEKEFEKLLNAPLEKNEEKVRERVNEMRKLEDKMKERLEGLREKAEKIDALKKQLEKLGIEKDQALKDGPAKDFEDALMKGQLDKAKAALDKLVKDLKNDKLDPAQQKEIAEQFKKLHDKLANMMDKDDFKKKLEKDLKEGKITKEEAAREMEKFKREMEQFKELQDLTDILGECQKCLGESDGAERNDKLDKLMNRFGEALELSDQEIRDLLRDQGEIGDAMRMLLEGLEGDDPDGDGDNDGLGGGGRPGTRRPISKNDPNSKIVNERQKAEVNPKGQQRISGYARGGTFKKVPATEVDGAFRQAAQDAPEALDRQRIPDDAAEITRRYFNKLGDQK